jgi:outer membrane lipoprotein-sorting protein
MNRLVLALSALPLFAQDARQIIEEVQRRSRTDSQRYEGTLEVADSKRRVSTKRWTFERRGSFGESKSLLRFTEPPEVKGIALLIHNHPDRASDQWMWRPAIERDQRIALQDRSTRFFGTDFSYEDLEERDVNQFDYRLDGAETLDGAACWRIESKPRKASQYTRSLLWVRKDDYTLRKVESFNRKGLVRRILYRDFEKVANVWTARTTEVYDAARDSRTVLRLDKLQYNAPVPEENFTLQALRRKS